MLRAVPPGEGQGHDDDDGTVEGVGSMSEDNVEDMVTSVLDTVWEQLAEPEDGETDEEGEPFAPARFVLVEDFETLSFGSCLDDYGPASLDRLEMERALERVGERQPDAVVVMTKTWAKLGRSAASAPVPVLKRGIVADPGPRPEGAVACLVAHVVSRYGVVRWLQPYGLADWEEWKHFKRYRVVPRRLDPVLEALSRALVREP